MNAPEIALEAEGLRFAFAGREVLRDVSLHVRPGELVALLGGNGAGKSTLLRLLAGFLRPDAGEVRALGDHLSGLDRREIARRLAYVPQRFGAEPSFSVREMVAMGRWAYLGRLSARSAEDDAAIEDALVAADLGGLAERSFDALSGGERQRVLFARALAQGSSVLLLDEPTASLDLLHAHRLMTHVADSAREGLAVLIAVHDVALAARFADRALVLSSGRLLADGSPYEVLTPSLFAEAFGVDASLRRSESGDCMLEVRGAAR
ncbi:MAG: ABC transporter ATP-binding protein [Deltaproteobacteria bacterium]|nr:ABC transporter ATP-binding protein [Deltaproteobacteria bacterium]